MSFVETDRRNAPRILIAAPVFRRLQLYIDLCPFEVGGLGSVEAFGDDLLVTSAILIRQRATGSDVELDSQAIADHLLQILREGRDPSSLRVWWHSHAEGPILWSSTDERTIEGMQIDRLVSIVGNKRNEFACRLDEFSPRRRTFDGLPLLPMPDGVLEDEATLRLQVMAELREKVTLIHRDVSEVPEIFLDPSCTLEIPIPFDEPRAPQQG
ncbi:MAG: hypothetical protein ACM362_06485 [Candidatus Methylomirabilota bacterium]